MDEKVIVPKTAFDKEYSTQWQREVKFLEDKGINFTYAKKHYKYPIITYKYSKTPELFLALAEYYNQIRNERVFRKIEQASKEVTPLEKGYVEVKKSELSEPEKKTMDFQINEQEVENLLKDDTE